MFEVLLVLLIGFTLTLLCVGVHYFFLNTLSKFLITRDFHTRRWVGFSILVMILAHVIEVSIFSLGYGLLDTYGSYGELQGATKEDISDFWYFSFVVYTSLGFGDIIPMGDMRLITAIETLTGLIMIAWSASFIYMQMQRCWTGDPSVEVESLPPRK